MSAEKFTLAGLSGADIGKVVSLESSGADVPWYIEGVLTNYSVEQEYIEEWHLLSVEPERIPAGTAYHVEIWGWDNSFTKAQAERILVSRVHEVD